MCCEKLTKKIIEFNVFHPYLLFNKMINVNTIKKLSNGTKVKIIYKRSEKVIGRSLE